MLSIIGCVVNATAHSVNTVIGGSVFVGCAVSCHSLAWAALPELFPSKMRPYVLGVINTILALVASLGPLIGTSKNDSITLILCIADKIQVMVSYPARAGDRYSGCVSPLRRPR